MTKTKEKSSIARPFVKWAGGKSKIANHIRARLPEKIDTYYEPLVGGGFMFFKLFSEKAFEKAVIGDQNEELINCYQMIKKDVDGLIGLLDNGEYIYKKETYLKIRGLDTRGMSSLERAARFIYLNKTGFNGLYRVNKDGGFNTPFGKYDDPTICDKYNLQNASKALQKVTIIHGDFDEVCKNVKEGDSVYFDPPYIPISKTSNFSGYTIGGFNLEDHIRLRNLFQSLTKSGVRCVLSNSGSSKTFELYRGFDFDTLIGPRCIGGPAQYRKSVKEVLIFAGPLS